MSPPSPASLQPAEREACLGQLKLLSARPELLSRPEYADVVLWSQRVAALARPADPAMSGKKLAAAVPSRIPAPPTRRARRRAGRAHLSRASWTSACRFGAAARVAR